MKCWCRLCRAWVYEQHFEVPGQYHRNGCGQGRDDIRYHPGNPLCGDLWRLKDGRYAVVDYKDPFCTGFTFSDGEKVTSRASQKYTEGVRQFLEQQQAELISTFEELAYPRGVDHRGWTDSKYKPDAADCDGSRSVAFIKAVLKVKREVTTKPVSKEAALEAARKYRDNNKVVCRVMMPHADEEKLWAESTDSANIMARFILENFQEPQS